MKYQDITHLAGRTFIQEGFMYGDLEGHLANLPYGDLSQHEQEVYIACWNNEALRKAVEAWWETYHKEKREGRMPGGTDQPWLG